MFNDAPIGTFFSSKSKRFVKILFSGLFGLLDLETWICVPIPADLEPEKMPKGVRRNGKGFQARFQGRNLGTFKTLSEAEDAYLESLK